MEHEVQEVVDRPNPLLATELQDASAARFNNSGATNLNQHELMALENDHNNEVEEVEPWFDCQEEEDYQEPSSEEEICTCRGYYLDDLEANAKTPTRLRKRRAIDQDADSEASPGGSDTTPGKRTRLMTDPFSIPHGSSNVSVNSPSSTNLLHTHRNLPTELCNWLLTFQRYSNGERILAINGLVKSCEPLQVRHMMKAIEPQFKRDFITLLPKELALQILSLLDPSDLLRAGQTCRSWR